MKKFSYPFSDDVHKLLKRDDVTISTAICPMEDCGGFLTNPFVINDIPQYAYWCTKCNWWTLGVDDEPFSEPQ